MHFPVCNDRFIPPKTRAKVCLYLLGHFRYTCIAKTAWIVLSVDIFLIFSQVYDNQNASEELLAIFQDTSWHLFRWKSLQVLRVSCKEYQTLEALQQHLWQQVEMKVETAWSLLGLFQDCLSKVLHLEPPSASIFSCVQHLGQGSLQLDPDH